MENDLQKTWLREYAIVPEQLRKVRTVKCVASAFNTNIDAVLKIKGGKIAELAKQAGLSKKDILFKETKINSPKDVVRGIIKCFSQGIAEEWLCEDKNVYLWMCDNLGYDRLQMGGQAGIVANVMSVVGVKEVLVHTNSHPKLQSEQFLKNDNLFAIDENGNLAKAYKINRQDDDASIHFIIEFDKGDEFVIEGKTFKCPKSNRFIATYDTANSEFKVCEGFVKCLAEKGYDYLILSGYHNLVSERGGVEKIDDNAELIKSWKKANPKGIIHLELASTQDKTVRLAILQKIAPLVDSIGLNEREALDALEVIALSDYEKIKGSNLSADVMYGVVEKIKKFAKVPRIQLHMFGLYVALQDDDFCITKEAAKRGMMLASTIAAAKCALGKLEKTQDLLWADGKEVGSESIAALHKLADFLGLPLLYEGIAAYRGVNIIAVPTILIDKPLTLVGMGDTISSISLIGAQE